MEQVTTFFENILTVENEAELDKRIKSGKRSNTFLGDKLMEKLVSMIIPVNIEHQSIINDRIEMQKTRPPLSVNTMSNNSVLLFQRLTNTFILFDNIFKFFNWYNPYYTVGVMLVMTHLILNPYLLAVLPVFLVINNILVPHYLLVHPPDTSFLQHNLTPDLGPQLHEATIPKPVPQFSQEFILNVTDVQNHMIYFIQTYDFLVWLTKDYLYYKNEDLTTVVYLMMMGLMVGIYLVLPHFIAILLSHITIVKLIGIISLWMTMIMMYPTNRTIMINNMVNEDTRIYWLSKINHVENQIIQWFLVACDQDPSIQQTLRLVEIFEFQKFNRVYNSWEPIGFTNEFYSLNHPLRKLNSRLFKDEDVEEIIEEEQHIRIPRVSKLELVKPPPTWELVNNNWIIDYCPQTWVTNNLINELVSIDNDEKWVYDFNDENSQEIFRRRRWVNLCKRVKKNVKSG